MKYKIQINGTFEVGAEDDDEALIKAFTKLNDDVDKYATWETEE